MRLAVAGLWHLGCVTAAGLASVGHDVIGYDADAERVAALRQGRAPLLEPGLDPLLGQGIAAGRLAFTSDAREAARGAQVLWVTADTPLDDEDRADLGPVLSLVADLAVSLRPGALALISSQAPVGFVRRLEQAWSERGLRFACVPENLRLGQALVDFLRPERVLAGVRSDADRADLERLLAPLSWPIEWTSVESAEMAKHALNGFLATSAAFANELARLCEVTGADARQVERALRSDPRVGPRAYVAPGAAFAGGTLARDLRFLAGIARDRGVAAPLVEGVLASNQAHAAWLLETVRRRLHGVERPVCAVLGLVYKPGTDTLRRSASVELCARLVADGAALQVHDPALAQPPAELPSEARLCGTALGALAGADLAVIATPWPEFRGLTAEAFVQTMRRPCVVDPGWLLADALGRDPRIDYAAAGRP